MEKVVKSQQFFLFSFSMRSLWQAEELFSITLG
jgi:hypothetical protein